MSTRSLPSAIAQAPRAAWRPVARLRTLFGVQRERRALERLDPALLDDIGVSAEEARREAARPIWDAPARPC